MRSYKSRHDAEKCARKKTEKSKSTRYIVQERYVVVKKKKVSWYKL